MSMLTVQQKSLKAELQKSLKVMSGEIKKALPRHMSADKFARIVLTECSKTPKLLECEPNGFFAALLTSAQLGLEINGLQGQCYLIPYGTSCQLQIGYKGLLELVSRSGEIESVAAKLVFEGDDFEEGVELCENGRGIYLTHKRNYKSEVVTKVFAVAKRKAGGFSYEVMSVEEVESIRKLNKGKSPAWENFWGEMAKKVVLKRLCKTLPLSTEIRNHINTDETFKKEIREDMTELCEGETIQEVEAALIEEKESNRATNEDKDQFYAYAKSKGYANLVTLQENTQIASGCDRDFLKAIMVDFPNRKNPPAQAEQPAAPVGQAVTPANEANDELAGMTL